MRLLPMTSAISFFLLLFFGGGVRLPSYRVLLCCPTRVYGEDEVAREAGLAGLLLYCFVLPQVALALLCVEN